MRELDPNATDGARALERLRTEDLAWMTSISPDGVPQTSLIWFLWRDGHVVVYSHIRAPRNANVEANPLVSFNLNSDDDSYVTMEGEARIDLGLPPSSAVPEFQAKYGKWLERYGWTAEWLAENYSIPIVITPTRWRLG